MIVPVSIKRKYEDALPIWKRLREEADSTLREIANKHGGYYFSRIKSPESVVLKIEKGEYVNPFYDMEDMFAASIIVPTISEIRPTRNEIVDVFSLRNLKPSETHAPERFDGTYDLHLILKLKDSPFRIDKSILNLRFEVQIKTLLQEAWAKASHDTIYKPKRLSYVLTRISSEIRALLELADTVIADLETAAKMQIEPDYPKYDKRQKIIDLLEKHWEIEQLPEDRRRAALIVERYMDLASVPTTDELDEILSDSRHSDYLKLRSVTPTQAIFMILFVAKDGNMPQLIRKSKRVLITEEMLDFCSLLSSIPEANRIDI